MRHAALSLSTFAVLLAAGCPSPRPLPDTGNNDAGPLPDVPTLPDVGNVCASGGSGIVCAPPFAITCGRGMETFRENCGEARQLCFDGFGCGVCRPGTARCDGDMASACAADGSGYLPGVACDTARGEVCSPTLGRCASACEAAESENGYIGCEYYPTPTINSSLRRMEFPFAVAVANAGTVAAEVTVTRLGSALATRTVAGVSMVTIELPWVEELHGGEASVLARQGAYHLISSQPVTVYQFNPLTYAYDDGGGLPRYSHTNDASLLLPAHVLTGNYVVMSRATHRVESVLHHATGDITNSFTHSGFVAVTAVEAATVEVRFTARTFASVGGGTMIRAYAPGERASFELFAGDVLQLLSGAPERCDRSGGMESQTFPDGTVQDYHYCTIGREYDLTGTQIRATGAVQVVSGHDCAFVPANRWACDHLEEQMFPVETWGSSAIVSITEPLRGEPNIVRIVSSRDDNTITFDPAAVHEPITLAQGELIEFEVDQHFRADGTQPFAIAQFMLAQDYAGVATSGDAANGDPSYSLAIPTEQYRTSYTFLAPDTYVNNVVNVTARAAGTVLLDGVAIAASEFSQVGTTDMAVARVHVEGGAHRITSDTPFGIVVYGFGRYTSYMYPGGLDLEAISAPF